VSSCVTKATVVVRRLPRAVVALPMPFLGYHGNKPQKKKKKKSACHKLSYIRFASVYRQPTELEALKACRMKLSRSVGPAFLAGR
jgi:hypothetical protein